MCIIYSINIKSRVLATKGHEKSLFDLQLEASVEYRVPHSHMTDKDNDETETKGKEPKKKYRKKRQNSF